MQQRCPRPIRIDGDVAYLPLTRGVEAVIDAADVPLVAKRKWYALRPNRGLYVVSGRSKTTTFVYLHRFLTEAPKGTEVDHADGDGLNNRRSNLRLCDRRQNMANTGPRRHNKSGFKGVYQIRDVPTFYARIAHKGERRHLGGFATAEEAQRAYLTEARRLYGEFARV